MKIKELNNPLRNKQKKNRMDQLPKSGELLWRGNMNPPAQIIPITFHPKIESKQPSQTIRLGKEKPQAPEGKHTARCVHVEPNWTFLGNRKVAVYFEIDDGRYAGTIARRFYPLRKLHDGSYEIAPKSKLMGDIKKLFPHELNNEGIDPAALFADKFFNIEVIRKKSKKGEVNSIVKTLTHFDTGW